MAFTDPSAGGSSTPSHHEVSEHASLAEHVYHSDPAGHTGPVPDGYTLVDRFPPGGGQSDIGFQAAAYQAPDGDIVIAYRGSDDLEDVMTYPDIGSSGQSGQVLVTDGELVAYPSQLDEVLEQAQAFTDKVLREHPDQSTSMTGHSLGGYISQVESSRTGEPGHAYNAPGAQGYLDQHSESQQGSTFYNHNAEGDLVSRIGTQYGESYTYPVPETGPLASHGMAQFSEEVANGAQPTDCPPLWGELAPELGPSEIGSLEDQVEQANNHARELGEQLESGSGQVSGQEVMEAQTRARELESQLEAERQGSPFEPTTGSPVAPEPLDLTTPLAGIARALAQLRSNITG